MFLTEERKLRARLSVTKGNSIIKRYYGQLLERILNPIKEEIIYSRKHERILEYPQRKIA